MRLAVALTTVLASFTANAPRAAIATSTSSFPKYQRFNTAFAITNSSSRTLSQRMASSSTSSSTKMSATDRDALINCPTIPLNNGMSHPSIGFGTYKVGFIPASASSAVATGSAGGTEKTAEECVTEALEVGYRFIECAEFYGNESEVGKAIANSGVPREELFICSKVWTTTIEKGDAAIRAQLDKTLADLGTDYVDLYLVHWPVPGKHVECYKTLEALVEEGKVRGIGLSNYAVEDYLEIKESGMKITPAVNQIEINPFLHRKNTIEFFKKEGVVLQSYRSLRDGKAFEDPTLVKMAEKYGRTAAQILGRWCVQNGYVFMPKSVKKERMIENAKVFDFTLSDDDMAELNSLTTPAAIETFEGLYRKCVNRDTSKDGTMDGVKMEITAD
uniref:NADP-dependent oxidoreductase domain-containing protein n=1 Tax=Ditylum brightwellii TaxID=49249 RepID=A0A7S4RVV4_9STRA